MTCIKFNGFYFHDKVGNSELQGYVSYKFSRKSKIPRKKIIFVAVLLCGVLTFSIIFALLLSGFKRYKHFHDVSYYFVCANIGRSRAELEIGAEVVQKLGGAGMIIEHAERFYLAANVYLSQDEAEEVNANISPSFENAQILKISKSFTKKQKRKLAQNECAQNCFAFMDDFAGSLVANTLGYISGEVSEAKFLSFLMTKRITLENLTQNAGNDELSLTIKSFENILIYHINNFFNGFYSSTQKNSMATKLLVSVAVSHCELFDNL